MLQKTYGGLGFKKFCHAKETSFAAGCTCRYILSGQPHLGDMDLISELFNVGDKEPILRIPLSTFPKEDSWYWMYDKGGKF